jgi:hypothetical protein
MNQELIRELEKQAEVDTETFGEGFGGPYMVKRVSLEKFAELLVRECAKFLEENSGYDYCNNAWFPDPEDMLKHFGIEP